MFDPVHVQCEPPHAPRGLDVLLLNCLATHLNENQSKAAAYAVLRNGLFITEFDLETLANRLQSPTELNIKKTGNESAVCYL